MSRPLLLDTGGWLRALAGDAPWEEALSEASELIVPGLVLVEVDYHLRRQRKAMHRVLRDLAAGAYHYAPPTPEDLVRARELDERFRQLDLGLVDASVVALAERTGTRRVLTIDADFVAVRFGRQLELSFELACPLP